MGSHGSKSRIPPEELSELLQNTHFDHKELKKWYLGFIKDCPDGTLDKHQFIDLYSSFYESGNARKFASHVFRTFDVNADGRIGNTIFKEFFSGKKSVKHFFSDEIYFITEAKIRQSLPSICV